jgi:hypothetical protein
MNPMVTGMKTTNNPQCPNFSARKIIPKAVIVYINALAKE